MKLLESNGFGKMISAGGGKVTLSTGIIVPAPNLLYYQTLQLLGFHDTNSDDTITMTFIRRKETHLLCNDTGWTSGWVFSYDPRVQIAKKRKNTTTMKYPHGHSDIEPPLAKKRGRHMKNHTTASVEGKSREQLLEMMRYCKMQQ